MEPAHECPLLLLPLRFLLCSPRGDRNTRGAERTEPDDKASGKPARFIKHTLDVFLDPCAGPQHNHTTALVFFFPRSPLSSVLTPTPAANRLRRVLWQSMRAVIADRVNYYTPQQQQAAINSSQRHLLCGSASRCGSLD